MANKLEEILSELGLQKQTKDKPDSEKELKKIFNAYVAVMTHKLGRAPTPEEFFAEVSSKDSDSSTDPVQKSAATTEAPADHSKAIGMIQQTKNDTAQAPSVFDTKVYFGKGEDKQPDPTKILYFEHPTGGTYDVTEARWLLNRPEVLNHIDSRPLYHDESDIMQLMLHGLMDHHDYNALKSSNMIGPSAEKMWDLTQDLQQKWHEINQHRSDKDNLINENSSHQSNIQDLSDLVDRLQDRVYELEAELQHHKGGDDDFDFSDHVDLTDGAFGPADQFMEPIDFSQEQMESMLRPVQFGNLDPNGSTNQGGI